MKTTHTQAALVDALGLARAELAHQKEVVKELEQALVETGAGSYEGDLYRATVSIGTRAVTAWKAIAEKLGASRQMVTANTRQTEVTRVTVSARKKAAA